MDANDFDSSGLNNPKFVAAMRKNFEQPKRNLAPHQIDTTQQPEDHSDYGLFSTLGGLLTWPGICLGILAIILALLVL